VRSLAEPFTPYGWAPSTQELARRAGLDPNEILRFDGNVPPLPLPSSRPAAVAAELARVNEYPHGGYPHIHEAIAAYAGVEPENVVLGAGADDLILLVARSFAGVGDTVAIPAPPTYPLFALGAQLAGATTNGDDEPALTFCCRPANPTGQLVPLPDARPLAVDEAYIEYAGDPGAVGLIDEGVVVIRTFS
jgi:histidinol-phosphate aminotransferase